MSEASDETLVQQVRASGDARAFEHLVARHYQRIRLLQRRLARNASDADDLTQETFLNVWRKLDSFRGDGPFAAWLGRIAMNTFRQRARRRGARIQTVSEQEATGSEEAARDDGERDGAFVELERVLALAPRDDQLLLVLAYGYEMTVAEIAATLERPTGTIKSQLHRSKARLRDAMTATSGRTPHVRSA